MLGSPKAVTLLVITDIMLPVDDGLVSVSVTNNVPWSSMIESDCSLKHITFAKKLKENKFFIRDF